LTRTDSLVEYDGYLKDKEKILWAEQCETFEKKKKRKRGGGIIGDAIPRNNITQETKKYKGHRPIKMRKKGGEDVNAHSVGRLSDVILNRHQWTFNPQFGDRADVASATGPWS